MAQVIALRTRYVVEIIGNSLDSLVENSSA